MADAFGVPLYAATTTRLLVDLNRSIGHRQLFSEITRPLSPARRREIIDRYYRPHRQAVEGEVARHIAAGARVLHVASHSFTPTLDGVARRADVAWLYDPRRPGEGAFARAWMVNFARRAPGLRLRRNYPYQGRCDGLTAWLRKRHPDETYIGIELEVNQRLVERGGAPWDELRATLVDSLASTLAGAAIDSAC
jgi:predicted N-formylglutamate amidohydrolase